MCLRRSTVYAEYSIKVQSKRQMPFIRWQWLGQAQLCSTVYGKRPEGVNQPTTLETLDAVHYPIGALIPLGCRTPSFSPSSVFFYFWGGATTVAPTVGRLALCVHPEKVLYQRPEHFVSLHRVSRFSLVSIRVPEEKAGSYQHPQMCHRLFVKRVAQMS